MKRKRLKRRLVEAGDQGGMPGLKMINEPPNPYDPYNREARTIKHG